MVGLSRLGAKCVLELRPWFWFILFHFACEQGLDGGGQQGDCELQKESCPVVLTPPLMFTPLYSIISDHPRRKEKISLGIVGGGAVVYVRVKEGRRGGGGAVTE